MSNVPAADPLTPPYAKPAMIGHLWRCRWGVLRLCVCLFVLSVFIGDTAARIARTALSRLPDADIAAAVNALTAQGRFADAVMLADDGLGWQKPGTAPYQATTAARVAAAAEQDSWWRSAKDLGRGALTGRGDSLESVLGAIGSDMLIVGDVRDLAIESARFTLDGHGDPVIAALSAVGIALTVAPGIDWAPAVLKLSRKLGTLTAPLAEQILKLSKSGTIALRPLFENVTTLARRTSPAATARLLRFANSSDDVAKLAAFAERQAIKGGPSRAFAALHTTGEPATALLRQAGTTLGTVAGAADDVIVAAAKKGPAGARWLGSAAARTLMRPHPILGLAKGLYKGNVQRAVQHALDLTTTIAPWCIAMLCGWAMIELWLLKRPRLMVAQRG